MPEASPSEATCGRCGRQASELPGEKSYLLQAVSPPGYLCNLCVVGLQSRTERAKPFDTSTVDGDLRSNVPLWQSIRADSFRYCGTTTLRSVASSYLRHPGFRFTYYLRKVAHYRDNRRAFGSIAYAYNRLMLHHYRMRYGFDISPRATIGAGLFIGHFGGVVVSPEAIIGRDVNVNPGVVLGAASAGPRKGAPVIEDRVWIGAHAVIVGRIRIGSDALIGPGAYVYFDVPSRAVILGNPGIIVGYTGSGNYIHNALSKKPEESELARSR